MRHCLTLALLLATTPATAGSGAMNAFGPYEVNPALTTGHAAGFRQLFVDPAQFGALVSPTEALGDATDDALHIQNRTNAWVELSVSGVRIGIVGPLTTVVLNGVTPGAYSTTQLGPTGMSLTRTFTSDRYEALKSAEAERLAAEQAAQEAAAAQDPASEDAPAQ